MARGHGTYSRLVAFLKILLPLIALGVLGTVFLLNSDKKISSGLTFSRADMATLAAGSFIRAPQISGYTPAGAAFSLTADSIKPQAQDLNFLAVTALNASLNSAPLGLIKINAAQASIDVGAQKIMVTSGGRIEIPDGTKATVNTLEINLASGKITGTGIDASGPLGHISADDFRLETGESENHVLWFKNNVRMVHDL